MKAFCVLFISAFARRTDENGRSESRDFVDCGGVTEFDDELTSVEISSPVDVNLSNSSSTTYPYDAFCEWLFKDDFAAGFHIDTIKFDIEG